MNAQEHVRAAEGWLARGEQAWALFDQDTAPRDPGLLRKAEVAVNLSRAHAALASVVDRVPVVVEHRAPNGHSIPVLSVPPSGRH